MKTIEQLRDSGFKGECIDGRDITRLAMFIPPEDFTAFGLKAVEGAPVHVAQPMTREAVIEQLKEDVAFGFEKALNKRGISAEMMAMVVMMWNGVLEEGLENYNLDSGYAQYGLPLFKATAIKYGFQNPIGDDSGTERRYASGG